MPNTASFESFEKELRRLVAKFERGFNEFKNPGYLEAQLRDDFLDPFLDALGWDLQNNAGLIQSHREVEIESRADTGRADYLFRIDRRPRFVCEAKKPAEELHGHAQQTKGYAWTMGVPLAVLTDFEELNIYIVGSEPKEDEPLVGLWKRYSFRDYVAKAREFLGNNDKVQVTVIFRGREMQQVEEGRRVLDSVLEKLAEVGKVERPPTMDGRKMTAMIMPIKGAAKAKPKPEAAKTDA